MRLIPPGANDPRIVPRVAILHVDAGNADTLFDYFAHRSGGIESHFFVKRNGVIEQYRDTDFQADANLDANDFAVSIETQGFGEGEWTPEQIDSIKRLLVWLHETHDIPLRKVHRWNGAGIGYHTLFGAPSPWTPVAKSCPGPDRIKQFDSELVPWMNSYGKESEDEITPNDLKNLENMVRNVVRSEMNPDDVVVPPNEEEGYTTGSGNGKVHRTSAVTRLWRVLRELVAKVDDLAAKVDALGGDK